MRKRVRKTLKSIKWRVKGKRETPKMTVENVYLGFTRSDAVQAFKKQFPQYQIAKVCKIDLQS